MATIRILQCKALTVRDPFSVTFRIPATVPRATFQICRLLMRQHTARYLALTALCIPFLAAQRPDSTVLKQVIIFGRHAARTPVTTPDQMNGFSALKFPMF